MRFSLLRIANSYLKRDRCCFAPNYQNSSVHFLIENLVF